jgi:uncharacterized protein YbjT (DUF2867 family)
MRVVVFGASGLLGDGILRASFEAPDVTEVLAVVRSGLDLTHPKLRVLQHDDFTDFAKLADVLAGVDACFWALGTPAGGVSPAEYERITVTYTVAAADLFAVVSPEVTFAFVSGAGTDSTGRGRFRWARVKGVAENAVIAKLTNGYGLRPSFILPSGDKVPRVRLYRIQARMFGAVAPTLQRRFPGAVITAQQVGLACLNLTRAGFPRRVLSSRDLAELAGRP